MNAEPDEVVTVGQLRAHGVPASTIHDRIGAGRWQRPLPRVVVLHSGPLTRSDRHRAALAYGGRHAVLSHFTAAALHGLRVTESAVHITVQHGNGRRSAGGLVVHQSRRIGGPVLRAGLPCTAVARTVIDVACAMRNRDDVRALVSDSVQRHFTTVRSLEREIGQAPRRGSRFLRASLDEVSTGARSAGEARFVAMLRRSGLPMPEFNARVQVPMRYYIVDALWPAHRLVVEIDGARWHLNAVSWEESLRRQNALQAAGFIVLRFPYSRLARDPAGVIQDIRRVLDELPAA